MPFADAADGGVAAHLSQGLDALGEQKSARTHAGGRQCGFRAGVAAADDDDIKGLGEAHSAHFMTSASERGVALPYPSTPRETPPLPIVAGARAVPDGPGSRSRQSGIGLVCLPPGAPGAADQPRSPVRRAVCPGKSRGSLRPPDQLVRGPCGRDQSTQAPGPPVRAGRRPRHGGDDVLRNGRVRLRADSPGPGHRARRSARHGALERSELRAQ